MEIPPDLICCEFHDGLVRNLSFDDEHSAKLHLASLNCFFPKANVPAVWETWAFRAVLTFQDFTKVTAVFSSKTLADSLNVYDVEFTYPNDDDPNRENLVLFSGKVIESGTVHFGDGGQLTFSGGTARLELLERLEYIEDFEAT